MPNKDHLFKTGNTIGKKGGRPKGSVNLFSELLDAVRVVEKREKKKLFVHFAERAFVNDKTLGDLMKKLVADKKELTTDPDNPLAVNIFLPQIKNGS